MHEIPRENEQGKKFEKKNIISNTHYVGKKWHYIAHTPYKMKILYLLPNPIYER